jgi:rubrerythrin
VLTAPSERGERGQMDRSIPAPARVPVDLLTPADIVDQAAAPKPQGRLPGLIAAIRDYRAVPPERALYREMLQQAVGRTITTYIVGGYEISAATIKLVAWCIFGRMNAAGCVAGTDGRPFSRTVIAADASIGERACRAAITFLKQGRLLHGERAGRGREMLQVTPWGLTWHAVKSRVKIEIYRNRGDAPSTQETGDAPSLLSTRKGDAPTAQTLLSMCKGDAPTAQKGHRAVGATALQGYVREGYDVQARPGPQAGGGAVPRTHAEAPAGRAAALDGDALIERDRQRSEAGHQAKVAAGKVKSVLVMESSEGGEIDETATPPSAAEKSTTVAGGKTETSPSATPQTADEKSSTADEGYTDEQYLADEMAYLERMDKAARARGAFRCSTCGCPEPGTVCPQCGARCGGD